MKKKKIHWLLDFNKLKSTLIVSTQKERNLTRNHKLLIFVLLFVKALTVKKQNKQIAAVKAKRLFLMVTFIPEYLKQ